MARFASRARFITLVALLIGSLGPAMPAERVVAQAPVALVVSVDSPHANHLDPHAYPDPEWTGQPDLEQIEQGLSGSPLLFVENVGQFDERARFRVYGGDGAVWLDEGGMWISLLEQHPEGDDPLGPEGGSHLEALAAHEEPAQRRAVNLRVTYPGSNPHPVLEPFNRLDTRVSYFAAATPTDGAPMCRCGAVCAIGRSTPVSTWRSRQRTGG